MNASLITASIIESLHHHLRSASSSSASAGQGVRFAATEAAALAACSGKHGLWHRGYFDAKKMVLSPLVTADHSPAVTTSESEDGSHQLEVLCHSRPGNESQ